MRTAGIADEHASHLSLYDALYQSTMMEDFLTPNSARWLFLYHAATAVLKVDATAEEVNFKRKARKIMTQTNGSTSDIADRETVVLVASYNHIFSTTVEIKILAAHFDMFIGVMTRTLVPKKYTKHSVIPHLDTYGNPASATRVHLNNVSRHTNISLFYSTTFTLHGEIVIPELLQQGIAMWQAITLAPMFETDARTMKRVYDCLPDALGLSAAHAMYREVPDIDDQLGVDTWLQAAAATLAISIVVMSAERTTQYGDASMPQKYVLMVSRSEWYCVTLDMEGWLIGEIKNDMLNVNAFGMRHVQEHMQFLLAGLPPYQPWFVLAPYYEAMLRVVDYYDPIQVVSQLLMNVPPPALIAPEVVPFLGVIACLRDETVWNAVSAEMGLNERITATCSAVIRSLRRTSCLDAYLHDFHATLGSSSDGPSAAATVREAMVAYYIRLQEMHDGIVPNASPVPDRPLEYVSLPVWADADNMQLVAAPQSLPLSFEEDMDVPRFPSIEELLGMPLGSPEYQDDSDDQRDRYKSPKTPPVHSVSTEVTDFRSLMREWEQRPKKKGKIV